MSTSPETLRTLRSTRVSGRRPGAGTSSRSISEWTRPEFVTTSTWRSTPLATPTATSPETETDVQVTFGKCQDAHVARHVRHLGPVCELAQAHVARSRLGLHPAAGGPHLEVARHGGEDGGAGNARTAQVPGGGLGFDVAAHRAHGDAPARRRRLHVCRDVVCGGVAAGRLDVDLAHGSVDLDVGRGRHHAHPTALGYLDADGHRVAAQDASAQRVRDLHARRGGSPPAGTRRWPAR